MKRKKPNTVRKEHQRYERLCHRLASKGAVIARDRGTVTVIATDTHGVQSRLVVWNRGESAPQLYHARIRRALV